MTWNYRVIKQQHPTETSYAIHEVYYDKQGINIQSISENSIKPHGETFGELKNDLKKMLKALNEPVLVFDEVLKTVEFSEILWDVGLSLKTCPKCGETGAHHSFVSGLEGKKYDKYYVKMVNADRFQCHACHEIWIIE